MVLLVQLNFSVSPWNEKVPAVKEAWKLFKIIMPKMVCHPINSPHSLFLTHLLSACYDPCIVLGTWHMWPHFTRDCFVAPRTQMRQEAGPWEGSVSFINHRETPVSIKCRASLAGEKVAALTISSTTLLEGLLPGDRTGALLFKVAPTWAGYCSWNSYFLFFSFQIFI